MRAQRVPAAGFAAALALLLFTILYPYDMWWAGWVWSRPSFILAVLVGGYVALGVVAWIAGRRPWPAQERPGASCGRLATAIVPVVFAGWCLLMPARGAVGDGFDAFVPRTGLSSQALFAELGIQAFQAFGSATGAGMAWGVRFGLAGLGALWALGCMRLAARLVGSRRGFILGSGLAWSMPSAVFAGYFERSGIVVVWIPWLVLMSFALLRHCMGRGLLLAFSLALAAALTHGSALCLAPALALGAALRRGKPAGVGRVLLAAICALVAIGATVWGGRWIASGGMGEGAALGGGGDTLALVAFSPAQLDRHHFAHYLLLSRWWWWERAQLLGALGPGAIAVVLWGLWALWRSRRRASREKAVAFIGLGGSLSFVSLWGFDWGLVGDWNMASPWLFAGILFLMVAARAHLRRLSLALCVCLALGFALPGLALSLQNRLRNPWALMPDPARWERTTGRGRTLYMAAAKPSWKWRTLGQDVELADSALVRISLTARRRSAAVVDRIEWVRADGEEVVASVEAEALTRVQDGRATHDWTRDGEWGAARVGPGTGNVASPVEDSAAVNVDAASGGGVAEIFRAESLDVPLVWETRLPAGGYRARVRIYESTWFPVGYIPVLSWEIGCLGK